MLKLVTSSYPKNENLAEDRYLIAMRIDYMKLGKLHTPGESYTVEKLISSCDTIYAVSMPKYGSKVWPHWLKFVLKYVSKYDSNIWSKDRYIRCMRYFLVYRFCDFDHYSNSRFQNVSAIDKR